MDEPKAFRVNLNFPFKGTLTTKTPKKQGTNSVNEIEKQTKRLSFFERRPKKVVF